jgi:membrane protein DedA with SNARE-associated domain
MLFPLASILIRIQDLMGTWGYPVLFGLLFSCGMGVPLPEDVPLLLAGYFIAIGKMHWVLAAICAWCGIVGGDCMLYSFGRRYGLGITQVPLIGYLVTAKRIQYAERLFQKYGIWVVGVGRMFAGIRGAMVVAAGTIRFNIILFLIADGIGAVISGGLFILLGYWAGVKFGDLEELRKKIHHYEQRVIIAALVLLALVIVYRWIRKKIGATPVVDKAMGTAVHQVEKKEHPKSAEIMPVDAPAPEVYPSSEMPIVANSRPDLLKKE